MPSRPPDHPLPDTLAARRSPPPATIDVAIALAAWVSGVDRHDIFAQTRCGAAVAGARQLAIYLSHVVLGHDLAHLASAFGRDRATLRHALRRIEDGRDDPDCDARLSRLEAILLPLRADAGPEAGR